MIKPLFEVFKNVTLGNPNASRMEQKNDFVERMKSDPAYLELLAQDYFERFAAVWMPKINGPDNYSLVRTEASQDKIERMSHPHKPIELIRRTREEKAARAATGFEALKAKVRSVILLDLVMPNGKALRDATGAECAKAGGFYAAVAKSIKPTQVVDRHLTEGDLQNIRARFYQINKTEVA